MVSSDSSRCTDGSGPERPGRLLAINDEDREQLVMEVLRSGHADKLLSLIEGYQPEPRWEQAERIAGLLAEERRRFGISCPPEAVEDQILMSALMTPVSDDALALSLARFNAHTVNTDDVRLRGHDGVKETLRVLVGDDAVATARASYTRHMLDALQPFADPAFLAVFSIFLGNAVVGALWEGEYPADVDFAVDPRYVRDKSGYGELWAVTLCFLDPSLDFWANAGFWAHAMQPLKTFLEAGNDAFSFYKEAVHGEDLSASEPYRTARRRDVPYHVAYGWAVDATVRAYHKILRIGGPQRTPFLKTFANGYLYWHAHSRRYRWQEIYPELKPLVLPG
ncbi:hypothetical protein [Streptomyces syringium]|uniref:hypothetical protein n=1 Tax=Streptomyces syringium TaxID=76729 RepID=UPI00345444F7